MPINFPNKRGLSERIEFKSLLLLGTLTFALGSVSAQTTADGVPGSLSTAAAHLLQSKSKVEAVRALEGPGVSSPLTAVLTGRLNFGWQIVVLSRGAGETYKLLWKTKLLDASFDVSEGDALQVVKSGGEPVVAFHGCQPHMCPEKFSALVFVPSRKQAYTATCHDGKTDYSFAEASQTEAVRSTLDHILHMQPSSDTACGKNHGPA